MAQQTVWIIGDWKRREFAEAIAWLTNAAPCVFFPQNESPFSRRPAVDSGPGAIVIVQSRPGQFPRHAIEQLYATAPLARLVALLGTWCEGEERSGRPWPGVARVPLTTWPFRLGRELGVECGARLGARLQRTATAGERLEAELRAGALPSRPSEQGGRGGRGAQARVARVYSCRKQQFECIRDLLSPIGIDASWCEDERPIDAAPDLIVIDGWEQASRIAQRSDEKEPSRRLLLMHFPREEDYVQAKMQGIDALLPLPVLLSDLAAVLSKMKLPSPAVPASAVNS